VTSDKHTGLVIFLHWMEIFVILRRPSIFTGGTRIVSQYHDLLNIYCDTARSMNEAIKLQVFGLLQRHIQ